MDFILKTIDFFKKVNKKYVVLISVALALCGVLIWYGLKSDEVANPDYNVINRAQVAKGVAMLFHNMEEINDNEILTVSFKVKNTGTVDGAEVCQLYVAAPRSKIFKAPKELKGFKKVFLKAGEEKEVGLMTSGYPRNNRKLEKELQIIHLTRPCNYCCRRTFRNWMYLSWKSTWRNKLC